MKKLLFIIVSSFLVQVSNAQTDTTDYFGQTPPSDSAVVFAPGLISLKGRLEGAIAFSPAGDELCLSVIPNIHSEDTELCPGCVILYSKKTGSTWSKLDTAYFAPKSSYCPIFSPDGQLVTFTIQGGDNGWGNIYYCNRTDTGWSQPQPFTRIINSERREAGHALTMNRTLYFSSGRNYSVSAGDVYRAKCINGEYTSVERVPNLSTPKDEDGVWVSPDESYAIVESWQDANMQDLYISFRKEDGSWTKLKNMGPKINSPGQDTRGKVSPDGKYLFFASDRCGNDDRDIYWIRVDKIIADLKKAAFAPILSK